MSSRARFSTSLLLLIERKGETVPTEPPQDTVPGESEEHDSGSDVPRPRPREESETVHDEREPGQGYPGEGHL